MPKSYFSLDTLLVNHFPNNTSGASIVTRCYSKLFSFAESTLDPPNPQPTPLGVEARWGSWQAISYNPLIHTVFKAWGVLAAGLGPVVILGLLTKRTNHWGAVVAILVGLFIAQFWGTVKPVFGGDSLFANGLIPVLNASLDSVGDIVSLLFNVNETRVWIGPFEDSVDGKGESDHPPDGFGFGALGIGAFQHDGIDSFEVVVVPANQRSHLKNFGTFPCKGQVLTT